MPKCRSTWTKAPFDYDVLWGNLLRFRFDGINLPTEAADPLGSKGFVSFRVSQKPDLPDGTPLTTEAIIGFGNTLDVNTNKVQHKIGSNFLFVEADEPDSRSGKLTFYPNPSVGTVFFELEKPAESARLTLCDAMGRPVFEKGFSGTGFRFERGGLPAGAYFFKIENSAGGLFRGKILCK